ncbi:hypothetical protein FC70_GL000974 [Paucilactobacillus oligofermentans DSM 15707 = LMG 22743]|uniref:Uncharacterized protein n=1 Tax=Paucilactobacillus oligofermentans DSM 15707 = LMG 22743 TaxID=1423778 RepID=A0A0R1RME7_9LACO|nr:hypothetical protein FC70_GL000974 [Paucilactobacillus oligofermentans DSM 15707 = LMG 22743]
MKKAIVILNATAGTIGTNNIMPKVLVGILLIIKYSKQIIINKQLVIKLRVNEISKEIKMIKINLKLGFMMCLQIS